MEKVTTQSFLYRRIDKNGSLTRKKRRIILRGILLRALGCEQEILVDTLTVEAGEKTFLFVYRSLTNMLRKKKY